MKGVTPLAWWHFPTSILHFDSSACIDYASEFGRHTGFSLTGVAILEIGFFSKDLVERPANRGSFSFSTRARDILNVMGSLLHYVAVVIFVAPYVFCLLKGKYWMAVWCFLLIPLGGLLFAYIGAIRMGHASSLWGRKFYDDEQIFEANQRFARWRNSTEPDDVEPDDVEQAPKATSVYEWPEE